MLDYVNVILHAPLYFYETLVWSWGAISSLPWIDWTTGFLWDAVRGFGVFLLLWWPRNYAERRWFKRRLGRKKATRPPDHQDTAVAASISGVFHH